jgi:hypothetical protein
MSHAISINRNYIDFTHTIYYPTASITDLDTIAQSLIGIERLARFIPDILNKSPLGDGVADIQVTVDSITAGSLKDILNYRLIFGDETRCKKWISNVRKITGIETMQKKLPVVGPIITGMLVVGGGIAAVNMIGKVVGASGSTNNINNCRNVVIVQGASTLSIPPAEFEKLITDNSGNVFNLASNSCRVLLPAKRGGGGVIVDDNDNLTITADAVKEVPEHVERSTDKPLFELFKNEPIQLRAMDVDNSKKGWAIVVPRISGKRLKLEIDPSVSVTNIAYHATMNADVELYYRVNDQGDHIYQSAYLRAVYTTN